MGLVIYTSLGSKTVMLHPGCHADNPKRSEAPSHLSTDSRYIAPPPPPLTRPCPNRKTNTHTHSNTHTHKQTNGRTKEFRVGSHGAVHCALQSTRQMLGQFKGILGPPGLPRRPLGPGLSYNMYFSIFFHATSGRIIVVDIWQRRPV